MLRNKPQGHERTGISPDAAEPWEDGRGNSEVRPAGVRR
jgi:hypothetical protein